MTIDQMEILAAHVPGTLAAIGAMVAGIITAIRQKRGNKQTTENADLMRQFEAKTRDIVANLIKECRSSQPQPRQVCPLDETPHQTADRLLQPNGEARKLADQLTEKETAP